MNMFARNIVLLGVAALVVAIPAFAQSSEEKAVPGFDNVVRRSVTFWSDGTRLAGDLTYPKGVKEGDKLPCIVMCHGWGGQKAHLNPQIAPRFAAEGYVVFTFDYRGWGESDSRLIVTGDMPKPDAEGYVTVKALAVKQLVDPLDQQEDIDAAITFVEGEPMVDKDRIGIWGSSFGGGHVVWRAAHDARVKCFAAQVGAMDQRLGIISGDNANGLTLETVRENKIKRVRGELEPVPLNDPKPEGLIGSPYYERFVEFAPVEFADKITVPAIIIDAELEHYFDNKDHGGKVAAALEGKVPVEYYLLKGIEHYDVYRGAGLDKVMELEIPFFNKYLKGAS